jgi:hypothetical protein
MLTSNDHDLMVCVLVSCSICDNERQHDGDHRDAGAGARARAGPQRGATPARHNSGPRCRGAIRVGTLLV